MKLILLRSEKIIQINKINLEINELYNKKFSTSNELQREQINLKIYDLKKEMSYIQEKVDVLSELLKEI